MSSLEMQPWVKRLSVLILLVTAASAASSASHSKCLKKCEDQVTTIDPNCANNGQLCDPEMSLEQCVVKCDAIQRKSLRRSSSAKRKKQSKQKEKSSEKKVRISRSYSFQGGDDIGRDMYDELGFGGIRAFNQPLVYKVNRQPLAEPFQGDRGVRQEVYNLDNRPFHQTLIHNRDRQQNDEYGRPPPFQGYDKFGKETYREMENERLHPALASYGQQLGNRQLSRADKHDNFRQNTYDEVKPFHQALVYQRDRKRPMPLLHRNKPHQELRHEDYYNRRGLNEAEISDPYQQEDNQTITQTDKSDFDSSGINQSGPTNVEGTVDSDTYPTPEIYEGSQLPFLYMGQHDGVQLRRADGVARGLRFWNPNQDSAPMWPPVFEYVHRKVINTRQ